MDIIIVILAVISSIHAYSYGNWLRKNQQPAAFLVIAFCAVLSLALPIYRLVLK